jgi:Leucine-rich repeat (LRR) protein
MLKPIVRSVVRPVVSGTVNPDNVYVGTIIWGGISYEVFTDPATGLRMRIGIRDGYQVIDEELTVSNGVTGGFEGVESTDGIADDWYEVQAVELFGVPLNLTIADITNGVRLTWEDNSSKELGYEIYASVNGGAFYSIGITQAGDLSFDDLINYEGLPVQYKVLAYTGVYSTEYLENAPNTIINKSVLNKPLDTQYAYVADNGGLDRASTGLTFGMWVKGTSAVALANYSCLGGKAIGAGTQGRYGFYVDNASNYSVYATSGIGCVCNFYIDNNLIGTNGGGSVAIVSTVKITDQKWHYLLMTFDNAVTTQPGNQFEFVLGAANSAAGDVFNSISKCAIKDVIVYKSELSTIDITNLYLGVIKSGYVANWKCDAYPLIDETGNFNLTGVNLNAGNIITTPERIVGGDKSGYSNIVDAEQLTFNLTFNALGDGSGISKIRFNVSETTTMILSGTARFYSDAAGTLNESTSAVITTGALRTFYMRLPSGNATLKVKNVITGWGGNTQAFTDTGWEHASGVSWVNYPFIDIDISLLTHLTTINLFGNNTVHGDMSTLTAMTYIELGNGYGGSNNSGAGCTITGDVSGMTNLWCLDAWDITSFYGDITGLVNLRVIWIKGLNTLSGSIAALTSLTYLDIEGGNTITGSLNALTSLTTLYLSGNNTVSGEVSGLINLDTISIYSSGAITITNTTNLTKLSQLFPCYPVVFSSANVNQILADVWVNRNVVKSSPIRTIDLSGNIASGAPTGQGITDKAALQAYRTPNNDGAYSLWTIGTN